MTDDEHHNSEIGTIEAQLEYARRILAHPVNLDPDEWMLLATIVGEADLDIAQLRRRDPSFELPLFEQVLEEFRDVTADFTDLRFLRASRAARRRNPRLFSTRGRDGSA